MLGIFMLRITVELVPFGQEDQKKKIAEMVIANAGLADSKEHNAFSYEAWTAPDSHSGEPARYGVLHEFNRSQSVWELVRLMLECIRLERHKPSRAKDSLAQRLKDKLMIE
jgi:hypothetical protein